MSKRYSALFVGASLILSLLIFAGCYPFQGDVTLLLTPVPTGTPNPAVVATAQALEQQEAAMAEKEASESGQAEEGEAMAGEAAMGAKGVVTARSLRVRKGPGTDTEVVAGLREGTEVTILGRNGDGTWLQIQVPDVETTGWVAAEFIQTDADLAALPVTAPGEEMAAEAPAKEEEAAMEEAAPVAVVEVEDQPIVHSAVVVKKVVTPQKGWIVIHADKDGSFGPVIGHAPVWEGTNTDVVVPIDPSQATETLYAMLHLDEGEPNRYEFPGPDVPVIVDGAPLAPAFQVTGGLPEAAMEEAPAEEAPAEEAAPAGEAAMEGPVAVVATRSLRVRLAPETDAPVVAGVKEGERYPIVGRTPDNAWLQLKIPGVEGPAWVDAEFVEVEGDLSGVPTNEPLGIVTVTTGGPRLRVRSAPSLDAPIVGYVLDGQRFTALEMSSDGKWVKLVIPRLEGETWVSADYVTFDPVEE